MIKISLREIKEVFSDILSAKISRKDADRWAYSLFKADQEERLVFSPSEDAEKIMKSIMFLYGIDIEDAPGEYLHSEEDIEDFLKNL